MNTGRENKPHIGIFGRRNVGKSSFINALTGQEVAIVSDVPGTTTDPVRKSIEIFGIGPAIVIDTAGIDDEGELGRKRIQKTTAVLKHIDLAILIISENNFGAPEQELIQGFKSWNVPFLIIHNKSDIQEVSPELRSEILQVCNAEVIDFNTLTSDNEEVIRTVKKNMPETAYQNRRLLDGLVEPGDIVMQITPIDQEAPEGRLILPQVTAIRDVLDHDGINVVLQVEQVAGFLKTCAVKPRMAITDSQVFHRVKALIPDDILLTSYSILFARHKGEFGAYLKGTAKIAELMDGDRILILESCTHQVNCDDIGRYKLPSWLRKHSGKNLHFDVVGGLSEPLRPVSEYAMAIQCGGCMITRKQVSNRLKPFIDEGIPVTNYGMAIAWMNGIWERAVFELRVKS